MKQQTINVEEFNKAVAQYNQWLESLDNPELRKQKRLGSFLDGMRLILDIFGISSINQSGYNHPLYSRKDLTPAQKDAIALASDWQKVGRTLDKVISGDMKPKEISVQEAICGRPFVKQMYKHFKNVYVANAMR